MHHVSHPFQRGFVIGIAGPSQGLLAPHFTRKRLMQSGACRSLNTLSKVSAVSLSLAAFFASASGILGGYAVLQGNIQNGLSNVRWWPSLGEFISPSKLLGLIGTLPVLLTSYVCHYNLHPVVSPLAHSSISVHWELLVIDLSYHEEACQEGPCCIHSAHKVSQSVAFVCIPAVGEACASHLSILRDMPRCNSVN